MTPPPLSDIIVYAIITAIALGIFFLVIRGAVLSALRKYREEGAAAPKPVDHTPPNAGVEF